MRDKDARVQKAEETKQGGGSPRGNGGKKGEKRGSALFITPSNEGSGGGFSCLAYDLARTGESDRYLRT